MAWQEAVTTGRTWDQSRDSHRIRAAFVTLAQTRESWPQPRHFLDALPRMEQAAIGYEVKPATKEEADAAINKIRKLLGDAVPSFKAPKTPKPTVAEFDKAAIEADLQAHYGKGKKA